MRYLFPICLVACLVLPNLALKAQNVGINSTGAAPHSSAMLDVSSTNKGVLLPRISLSSVTDATTIASPTVGLLVYNSNASITGTGANGAGYYYYTGAAWSPLTPAASGWLTTGNASTTDGTHYIGTSDNVALNFRINNTKAGRIEQTYGHNFFGYQAGNSNSATTANSGNTGIGYQALYTNSTGFGHTACGYKALYSSGTNWQNAGFGGFAGYSMTGNGGVFVGWQAGYNITGNANTVIGYQADNSGTSGQGHTVMGYQAVPSNLTTSNNVTAIGSQCALSGNYTNGVVIGGGATLSASNKVRFGDASITVVEGQVAYTNPSDGRFKNTILENVPGLAFIKKLRPVTYKFDTEKFDKFLNGDTKYVWERDFTESKNIIHTGFIAQEVEKAAKECGFNFDGVHAPSNPKDNYGIAYSQFVVPLVKSVQEQQEMIETQQKTINTQQEQIKSLLTRLEALENKK